MPREIVHWIIAQKTISALGREHPILSSELQSEFPAFLLGSVIHDAPYFLNFGRDQQFTKLAEILHGGNGEDTFLPLRHMLNWTFEHSEFDLQTRKRFFAFVAGMLSHIIVDELFHPSIFYFTGNYYDVDPTQRLRARLRHRQYEVALDKIALEYDSSLKVRSVDALLQLLGVKMGTLSDLLGSLRPLFPEQHIELLKLRSVELTWRRALNDFALCQRAFRSHIAGLGARFLGKMAKGKVLEYSGLFAGDGEFAHLHLDVRQHYLNPISGAERADSIRELFEQAVKKSGDYLAEWEPLFHADKAAPQIPTLIQAAGPNLTSGIIGSKNSELKFFA